MSVSQSVAGMLREHVTLEVESIDRLYLNVYVPKLQRVGGVVGFFREVRGATFASSALMEPITTAFVKALERCAQTEGVPLLTFAQGQRKDEVAQEYLAAFSKQEGVLFIGKAQEKATVWHTERRYNAQTGQPYAWLVKSTALVNQYDIYAVDANFGPFFLKFCSYFPYNAKLCLNGHEYLKRQLVKEGIAFEALDNGILSCANPARLQEICDGLDAPRIDALLRVPLGCAEMMCFGRKTIGVAGRMGRLRPSAGLRTSRTALFWLTDKTCSEDLSSISAGPNGTDRGEQASRGPRFPQAPGCPRRNDALGRRCRVAAARSRVEGVARAPSRS